MRIMQIVLLILSMFVLVGGLALPIWWNAAQPIIFSIPEYLNSVVGNMAGLLDLVLKSF